MATKTTPKEKFKDLYIHCRKKQIGAIRLALAEQAKLQWRHAPEKEIEATQFMVDGEIVIFERAASDNLEAAGLFIGEHAVGLKVFNIVPMQSGQLGTTKYNQILDDFVTNVADRAKLPEECWIEIVPIGTKPTKQNKCDPWSKRAPFSQFCH